MCETEHGAAAASVARRSAARAAPPERRDDELATRRARPGRARADDAPPDRDRAERSGSRRHRPTLALARAIARGVATAATFAATAFGAILLPNALAAAERFRLPPGSLMQNDGPGGNETVPDGTVGYARGFSYRVTQGYAVAEGDIVLGRVDSRGRLEVPIQRRGLGQASLFDRWPDGVVPYRLDPALSEVERRNVQAAIEHVNERTRVEVIPADDPAASDYNDYVLFESSNGCASFVGRQRNEDAQSVWVSEGCSVGSVVHEIAHAIGLFHEHTRPDRDNYIEIAWDRIASGSEFNFEIYAAGTEMYGEYDYGSITHYGERFFSRDGEPTIIAPPNVTIGQRVALSAEDIRSIDRMYATDLMLDARAHRSERGVEIDVSITNIGDLGARRLLLRVQGDGDTVWRSISTGSGWSCLAHETELRCERERLVAQASSRFTIVADGATVEPEAIALQVDSRTLDTDPSNNGVNAGAFDGEPDDPGASVPDRQASPSDDSGRSGSADADAAGGRAGGTPAAPELGEASGAGGEPADTASGALGGEPAVDAAVEPIAEPVDDGAEGGGAAGAFALLATALTLVGRRLRPSSGAGTARAGARRGRDRPGDESG